MKKKLFAIILSAALLLGLTVPVMAATASDPENIISIELPDDTWYEVQDPTRWLVFSDGVDMITIDHYANGEKLPEIVVANPTYVNTLTAAFSTQNEVFIASGFIRNHENMPKINQALYSIKVLKYDTKTSVYANAPAATPAPTKTPTPTPTPEPETPNETLLVYSQGSGRPVNITGSNGIYYDGFGNTYYAIGGAPASNFVDDYGAYYSTTMPVNAPETEVVGLVSDGSGRPVSIVEGEDGSFTDEEGNAYYENEDGSWSDDYDATYQVNYDSEFVDQSTLWLFTAEYD